ILKNLVDALVDKKVNLKRFVFDCHGNQHSENQAITEEELRKYEQYLFQLQKLINASSKMEFLEIGNYRFYQNCQKRIFEIIASSDSLINVVLAGKELKNVEQMESLKVGSGLQQNDIIKINFLIKERNEALENAKKKMQQNWDLYPDHVKKMANMRFAMKEINFPEDII